MVKGTLQVKIPNPQGKDIDKYLLGAILKQAGIDRQEWESV